MDKEKFGKFVATLRKEQGLTQKELAQKVNLTDKAISKWERGLSYPDISILEQLSIELDISILELMKGERMPQDLSLSVEEAKEVVDQSLEISDHEITRKHIRSKNIILLCLVLVMLLVSIVLNVRNYASYYSKQSNNDNWLNKQSKSYETELDKAGKKVFVDPVKARKQLQQDLTKKNVDKKVTEYLEILERSYEEGKE